MARAMSHQKDVPDQQRALVVAVLESLFAAVDRRDWVALARTLASEVGLDYGKPEVLSPEQIVDRWKPLFAGLDKTDHRVTDFEVDVIGDTARVHSRFHASHFLNGAAHGDTWILDGAYDHELVRTDGEWRVSAMKMTPGKSVGNAAIFEDAKARTAAKE